MKYTKDKNGYFRTRVFNGTYKDGKKCYTTIYSKKSSKDLERKVAEMSAKVKGMEYFSDDGTTFMEYSTRWEETYKGNRSANTRAMYQNIINVHFACISCRVADLSRSHFVMMMNSIKGKRTRQQALMVFKQVLKSAIHDKLLPASSYDDILDGFSLEKYRSKEKRPLTDLERKAIAEAELSDRDRCFLLLLYGCGMRRGECAALMRDDIDLENMEVTINKALAYVGQEIVLKDTKNGKHRTVPIPVGIVPSIARYLEEVPPGQEVFAMKGGNRLTKSSLDKMWLRIVKSLEKACGSALDDLTPHILRHNYCTTLCYQIPAIGINDIAYLMGDSKQVVLDIYNHLDMDRAKVSETVSNSLDFCQVV